MNFLKKQCFLSLIFLISTYLNGMEKNIESSFPKFDESWNNKESEISKLFNTKLLSNPQETETHLIKTYNFKKESFRTTDDLKLECLVRKVEKPLFTIIVSAGFLPGIMTGMATLIAMLPKQCNIIFYNNRGKGNSDGSLWSSFLWRNLRHYGTHEYKDVLGALDYAKNIHKENGSEKTPIFLYGICAGALNTIKAVCKLQKNNTLSDYQINGLILDSAVTSVQVDLENIPTYTCAQGTFCGFIKKIILWTFRYTIFNRWFMAPEKKTTSQSEILAQTKIPTLHFNCKIGDPLTTYERTNLFYTQHKEHLKKEGLEERCTNHCFAKSKHALHHIKHKEKYAEEVAGFMSTCLKNN